MKYIINKAEMPTTSGYFNIHIFQNENDKSRHIVALTTKKINPKENVLVRVHSKCLTGDTFESLRCDCGEQLKRSMQMIAKSKNGILIYLEQEGRGIGIFYKIKAYELQEKGIDTYDANTLLGFKPDQREYKEAVDVLKHFNIKNINLITNNPEKVSFLEKNGIVVKNIVKIKPKKITFCKRYLKTKKEKFGHFID